MSRAWRERLLRLTIGGLELCAVYTVLSLVNFRAMGGGLNVPLLLLFYLISMGFSRVFLNWKVNKLATIGITVALWLLFTNLVIKLMEFPGLSPVDPAFLLAVPRAIGNYATGFRPELIIFIASMPLWFLGYRLGRARIGFVLTLAEFQCTLAVILFTYFLNSQIGASMIDSVPVTLIFIALSIVALALSHAEQQSSWLGGRHSAFWFILLGASIVIIIFLGFTAGNFATHDFIDLLLMPLRWIWWAFSKFMLFLAEHTPMSHYIDPLGLGNSTASGGEDTDVFRAFQMPTWLRDGLRFGLGALWFIFVVVALWRISSLVFQWLRSHFVSRYPADYESLDGAFKDDFKRLLAQLWALITGFFRRKPGTKLSAEAESVRQIYRDLLAWGAAKGVRREAEQTPYEYLFALSEAVPLVADDLRAITDRYVDTRYGAIAPGKAELSEIKATWQRIKRNGEKK